MRQLLSGITDSILLNPIRSSSVLAVFLFLSFWQASKLTVNSNNLDLLPKDNPSVVKTQKVIEMIGGNGFYILSIKFKDEKGMTDHLVKAFAARKKGQPEVVEKELKEAEKVKQQNVTYYKERENAIKKASDVLNERLLKEKKFVQYISYRYNVSFLQDRLPLFLKTEDLLEVRKRVKRKIDEEVERANPFFIKLSDEEYNPDFSDILSKYQKLAKRDIFDEYNISPDKGMLIFLIKPAGSFTDIEFNIALDKKIKEIVAELAFDKKGIQIGYTGTYRLHLDDYETLMAALKPIAITSFIGIAVLLLFFFRNPLFILILLVSLLSGILFSFGLTTIVIGQLNSVTSIIASILMGLGIDYGIQFLYRFREEFTRDQDTLRSIKDTIYHTGIASFISALTTTSAFVVLAFSEFRGFSEFGIIATYGILIIAVSMYGVTALQITLLFRLFPSLKNKFLLSAKEQTTSPLLYRFYKKPGLLTLVVLAIVLAISFFNFSPGIRFNYNGRDLMVDNLDSVNLYDEIGDRFDISSDPQVIVVDTLEESEAVFDYMTPVPDEIAGSVDQVVSLWNFLPTKGQQRENLKILKQLRSDMKPVKAGFLKPEQRKYLPVVKKYLNVKEYSLSEVPIYFSSQFTEVKGSKEKGHLVFIYPKVALWHGQKLLKFFDAVGELHYPKLSRRVLNTLLYDSNGHRAVDPIRDRWTPAEKRLIVKTLNTYSASQFKNLGLLDGTISFILKTRPFSDLEQARSHKYVSNTAGSLILFANLIKIVQKEGVTAFLVTLILVVIVLILFFRGIVPALISLIPLVLGIFVTLGIMALFRVQLNFMNVLVFPVIIGYGIQNGIYIYYRFREDHDVIRAMSMVGPAIIASTLTTLVGWSSLLIADQKGLKSIGIVASIGIASSLLIALTLVPAILEIVYRSRKEEEQESKPIGFGEEEPNSSDGVATPLSTLQTTEVSRTTSPKKKSAKKKAATSNKATAKKK
ncbi:export membrane protein [Leptospira weilii str. 2006001853]|uniref:Export membrane protein n=1 Tax=Leptospira weilii str. 2006001853 TaxID=1001589 RepID=A0A828YX34_9LEPT|nr:MMPL family transporter [Leptospira weilii]EKR63092.1 export membrane protein [Leptospira weilii str. 2006001853]EMN43506.1 export membrane protein [Leptospira weilii str. LNT 1234]QDK22650.1 transporter [Leptospira weilii]QDK27705.1 transporter [Leptospira weilii]